MKKIKFGFIKVFIITLFISCGETNVVEIIPETSSTAPSIPGYFKKNVLIEDYTGTWCGNCTRVAYAIEQVKLQTSNVVSVAIHNGNDPFHFEDIAPLQELVSPGQALQLPISRLNRVNVWTYSEVNNLQEAIDLTGNNSGVGLSLNSIIQGQTINLSVNVKYVQNYSNLKVVVYLLEDKLIYRQEDYSTYYGLVSPQHVIQNFEHNHVLRAGVTNLLGDSINSDVQIGEIVTKSFSIPVPANIVNPDNISFAAFLVDPNNEVVNAREAHINVNQEFQENE